MNFNFQVMCINFRGRKKYSPSEIYTVGQKFETICICFEHVQIFLRLNLPGATG